MATDEQKAFDQALADLKDAQDARAKVAADYVRADDQTVPAEGLSFSTPVTSEETPAHVYDR